MDLATLCGSLDVLSAKCDSSIEKKSTKAANEIKACKSVYI